MARRTATGDPKTEQPDPVSVLVELCRAFQVEPVCLFRRRASYNASGWRPDDPCPEEGSVRGGGRVPCSKKTTSIARPYKARVARFELTLIGLSMSYSRVLVRPD